MLCGLAKHFFPSEVDFDKLDKDGSSLEGRMSNCRLALEVFEKNGVPMLLEAEDLAEQVSFFLFFPFFLAELVFQGVF